MRRLNQFAGVAIAIASLLGTAVAQQMRVYREGNAWVQEITGSLPAAKTLKVKVDVGSVRVQGGNPQGISYVVRNRAYVGSEKEAHNLFEKYRVSAGSRGESAWLAGDWTAKNQRRFSGEVTVQVPKELDLAKLETKCGEVSVANITGNVSAVTGGGNVRIEGIGGTADTDTRGGNIIITQAGGAARVSTGGGNVELGSIGGSTDIESGGGNVKLVSSGGEVNASTGGGNIWANKCSKSVRAETGGGNIELGDVGGEANMETAGGRIRLGSAKGAVHAETGGGWIDLGRLSRSVYAQTGSGGIKAEIAADSSFADSQLETPTGDIIVYLSPQLAATIQASIEVASGHTITSEFSDIHITSDRGDWGPKTVMAEGRLNGGGPILKVRTTTGNIEFRRLVR